MDDGKNDEPKPEQAITAAPATRAEAKQEALKPATIEAEVIEQVRRGSININTLLIQIGEKSKSSEEFVRESKEMLELTRAWEDQRIESFRRHVDAIVHAKNSDPDEIEKRRNNRTRRHLKYVIGIAAPVCLGGALIGLFTNIPVVCEVLFLAIGALCLAVMPALATGESVSTNDVVNLIRETRKLAQSAGPAIHGDPRNHRNTRKKR